jgi:hypothetical protein
MIFPPREDVLNGIERGEVVNCSAITDRGKSTLWRNIAISLACGRAFAPVVEAGKPRRILYLDFEARWRKLKPDIDKMLGRLTQADRAMISENLHVIADYRVDNWPFSLNLQRHWNILESEVKRLRPDVVIVDTLTTGFEIENENDNAEATRVMKKLIALATKWDCVVVFLHHVGKLKQEEGNGAQSVYRSRGGSAYEGCAHAVFYLLPYPNNKDRFTLECAKLKGEKWANTVFEINKGTRWCDPPDASTPAPAPIPATVEDRLLALFNGHQLGTKEIKKQLKGVPERTVDDALRIAVEKGILLRPRKGLYQKPVSATQHNPTSRVSQNSQSLIRE